MQFSGQFLKAMIMNPAISFVWLALGLHSVFNLVDLKYSEAQQLQRGEYQHVNYAYFQNFFHQMLNISQVLALYYATDDMDCALKCLEKMSCFSFNFATLPADSKSGRHLCELLASDKYNHANSFVPSRDYHHFAIWSPCESLPCQNGRTCRPLYDTNSYVCQCAEGNNGTFCENECHKALGMASGAIANEQINASSRKDVHHSAHQGRLFFKETKIKSGSWSVVRHDLNQSSWLQIDLNNKYTKVLGVSTQGRDSNPQWPGGLTSQWVTRYNLQYSDDGVIFQYYKEEGQAAEKEFSGNNDRGTVVYHELNPPIRARYIRFRPMAWHGWISMRAELYGCKGSWQNINANPVCFGAKDNSFGTFAIHKPGDIYRLKLVHHSGYVNCIISDSASATKWGCSSSQYAKKVNVHITDENNNRVFPTAGSVSFDRYNFYELPGFDKNSAEIVLDFFPAPLSVAAGQKFRIWYGEDLMNSGEGNNVGKSCVDVYGFY